MFFSKLRKNNTACMERYIPKDSAVHQGIYIDIFPCDNLSDHKPVRKLQFFASKVVIAKSLDQRGYLTDSVTKKLFMFACRLLPRKPLLRFARMDGRQNTKWVHTFFGASSRYEKSIFPREWFSDQTTLPFGDGQFPVSAHYDGLLTRLYGDYMTPLPESQRGCKVHGQIVDTERSYEAYLEAQRTMEITQYSRSIR